VIEVTKEEFYKKIDTLIDENIDVYLSVVGNYPYTTLFKTKIENNTVGYIQDHGPLEDSEYFWEEK